MEKRVLFISDHGDPLESLGSKQAGGQNNYVKQLALALEDKGVSVDVVTHWNSFVTPKVESFGKRCRVIRLAAGKQRFVPKDELVDLMPIFYEELKETLSLESYDAIHTHYWLSGLVGSFISKELDTPWLHTNHSLGIVKQRATGVVNPSRLQTERMILSTADAIVATSPTEKRIIQRFVNNPSHIHVIPIGVDQAFTPTNQRKRQRPSFVFAGRLQEEKGIYTLIEAYERLLTEEQFAISPILFVAGGSETCVQKQTQLPKKKELKSAVRGLEQSIKFLGPQDAAQLANLFSNAVATIVPSYYESFGMVAAEAQACGSPVIASRVGGLQDVVKHGKTGLHVATKNPRQLKTAMASLLHSPFYAQKLGEQAGRYAAEQFNWSVIASRINDLYHTMTVLKNTARMDGSMNVGES